MLQLSRSTGHDEYVLAFYEMHKITFDNILSRDHFLWNTFLKQIDSIQYMAYIQISNFEVRHSGPLRN